MRTWLRLALLGAALSGPAGRAGASVPGEAPGPPRSAPTWVLSGSAYAFFVPDSRSYVNPNVAVDRGGLHLEARYNYEAIEAGSVWVGWGLGFGEELAFRLTPMLGGVFGSTSGFAPGWLLSLEYKAVSLSSQGEWLVDTSSSSGDFLYSWSELSWAPLEWLRAGLAIQRTRTYDTGLEIQRGFLVGFTYRDVELAAYVFNLGWQSPTVVVAVAIAP